MLRADPDPYHGGWGVERCRDAASLEGIHGVCIREVWHPLEPSGWKWEMTF